AWRGGSAAAHRVAAIKALVAGAVADGDGATHIARGCVSLEFLHGGGERGVSRFVITADVFLHLASLSADEFCFILSGPFGAIAAGCAVAVATRGSRLAQGIVVFIALG